MKKELLCVCWILCTGLSLSSFGQFTDSIHHLFKYDITGVLNRTNSNRAFILNNGLSFQLKKKYITLTQNTGWIYGTQNRILSNNDLNSVLNMDILKDTRRLYYWALASFTSSYSLRIAQQTQVGGGIGYNLVNKPNGELVISDGLLYEFSNLRIDSVTRKSYQTVRNSLRIKHRLVINDMITLNGTHFWQPSLKDISDNIIRSSATLSIRLKKWLMLSSGFTYNHISRTQRENLLFSIGLGFEKYF